MRAPEEKGPGLRTGTGTAPQRTGPTREAEGATATLTYEGLEAPGKPKWSRRPERGVRVPRRL